MNKMNELEMHLRSWAPRPPSRKLKNQIFGLADAAKANPIPTIRFGWLAPACAALLLVAVLFNQRTNPTISGSNATPMVAMILSNQSAAAYLPGSFQREQNNLPAETFEWTNGSGSTSSIGSLSHAKGNNRNE